MLEWPGWQVFLPGYLEFGLAVVGDVFALPIG